MRSTGLTCWPPTASDKQQASEPGRHRLRTASSHLLRGSVADIKLNTCHCQCYPLSWFDIFAGKQQRGLGSTSLILPSVCGCVNLKPGMQALQQLRTNSKRYSLTPHTNGNMHVAKCPARYLGRKHYSSYRDVAHARRRCNMHTTGGMPKSASQLTPCQSSPAKLHDTPQAVGSPLAQSQSTSSASPTPAAATPDVCFWFRVNQ
jgi:hypothetical protein